MSLERGEEQKLPGQPHPSLNPLRPDDAGLSTSAPDEAALSTLTAQVSEPVGFHFNVPKVEGKGEDADPVAVWKDDRGVLAVFDGMGGAGSTVYQYRGASYTGAYIASRVAANEVQRFFAPAFPLPSAPLDVSSLQERLCRALQSEAAVLETSSEPSRLKSKLIRRLPTTLAMLSLQSGTSSATCQAVWAGDSRCYALSPSGGLQQLTTDDLKTGGDALANLTGDSPLSNCLNADGEFALRSQAQTLPLPSVFLAATDGCFGYLFSPAHFEFVLLDGLMTSKSGREWREAVIARLKGAGDDCSMALLALGWPSFTALQSAFAERHRRLYADFIAPLDALTHSIEADAAHIREAEGRKLDAEKAREQLRRELWLRYKATHDKLLSADTSGLVTTTETARRAPASDSTGSRHTEPSNSTGASTTTAATAATVTTETRHRPEEAPR